MGLMANLSRCIRLRLCLGTLKTIQNGRHFADDHFKCIFLNANVINLIKMSLKFVPKGPDDNILALVQIMAWRRPGDKPLSEPVKVIVLTHICVIRPQRVNRQAISKHNAASIVTAVTMVT